MAPAVTSLDLPAVANTPPAETPPDMAAPSNHAVSLPGSPVAPNRPRPNLKNKRTNTMNGPLYMQTSQRMRNVMLVQRPKRKDESLPRSLVTWFVENQIGLLFNLLALLFLAHVCIPRARPTTRKFFHLSYYNSSTGRYAAGRDDAMIVAFCLVVLTGLRAFTMEYVLATVGKRLGLRRRKQLTRFSEQAWICMYHTSASTLGIYLHYKSPYFADVKAVMTTWPRRDIDGLFKTYILAQTSFWLQQIFVLHIEKLRKDYMQMFAHHIVTVVLIVGCYLLHLPHIGLMFLILTDTIDILLPLAKCLKYTGFNKLCDLTFAVFASWWFLSRHVLYVMVCMSIYKHMPRVIPKACWHGPATNMTGPLPLPEDMSSWSYLEPLYNQSGSLCWKPGLEWIFLGPLLTLQAMQIVWFGMIIRVAVRVIRGDRANDSRSDDDEAEDEEMEEVEVEVDEPPLEEEVGVEDLDLKLWDKRTGFRRHAATSGVSFPGHSDRKELLGRIGCDKQAE